MADATGHRKTRDHNSPVKQEWENIQELIESMNRSEKGKSGAEVIMAAIGDGISIQDTNYKILYQNPVHINLIGNHSGEYCYQAYEKRDRVCEGCPLSMSFKDGRIHTEVRTAQTESGIMHIEITASPLRNPSGKIIGGIEVVRDITERLRMEEELLRHHENLSAAVEDKTAEMTSVIELLHEEIISRRESEEALRISDKRYRGLFNYMFSGVAVYGAIENGSDFVFKDFNKSAERIEKISKEELLGKRVMEVFPGIREMGLFDVLQRVWKTGKPEFHPASEYKDQRITGWREHYIYKLPSGEIVSVYDDITEELESAERELKLLRELKTIFDNFPLGIVYLDDKFRIISSNKFFNNFAGYREDELTGKLCYEIVGEYANNPAKKGLEKICSYCKKEECIRNKRSTIIERTLGDKFIRVTTIPELDESGNVCRFMEIVEDITERKLSEAEVIRAGHLASLGELAAGVAHEINNPINGIINYAQLLSNKIQRGSREHDITNRIIKESDRIAQIVKNLLSFASDSTEEKRPTSIREVMSDTLGLTVTQLRKDGILLSVDIPEKLSHVVARPQHLEQVFLNIISNARHALNQKYTGADEDKVFTIQAADIMIDEKPHVRITFYDRGSGIPEGIMNKVMNPFFSTKSADQGTGLGLSISHGIISSHGGKLTIDSVEGEFTRVIIELPVRQ